MAIKHALPRGLSCSYHTVLSFTIYFQDLKADTQSRIWQEAQRELLARGDIAYREEDESEEEFERRLMEETDYYLNCNNFANEFRL